MPSLARCGALTPALPSTFSRCSRARPPRRRRISDVSRRLLAGEKRSGRRLEALSEGVLVSGPLTDCRLGLVGRYGGRD